MLASATGLSQVATATWALLGIWVLLTALVTIARLYSAHATTRALRRQTPLAAWRLACAISLGLAPVLLGLALTALAVIAETVSALRSSTAKDILIPVIVGIAGAALYDRVIHARDLYWEFIDRRLDSALNRLPPGAKWWEPPTCLDPATEPLCQRQAFNSTHAMLATDRTVHRRLALKRVLEAPVCSNLLPIDGGRRNTVSGSSPPRLSGGGDSDLASIGVVQVPWYATGFQGDQLERELARISAVSTRYGAAGYTVYRSRDDHHRLVQILYFSDGLDWERYWESPEVVDFRITCQGRYQIPVAYGWHDLVCDARVPSRP